MKIASWHFGRILLFTILLFAGVLAQGKTITFDDLSPGNSWFAIPNGYEGLTWSGFGVYNGSARPASEGYHTGAISASNVAFNIEGSPASFGCTSPFDVHSAYVTAAFVVGMQVRVLGYAGGYLVYDNTFTVSPSPASLLQLDYVGVDRVSFIPSPSSQFALDNLNVTLPDCIYTISPASRTFSSMAATGTVSVAVAAGCAWTATTSNVWITIPSGQSGAGDGTIVYTVAANSGTATRTGTIRIAEQNFTVTQSGSNTNGSNVCTFSLLPTSRTHNYGSTTNSVSVTTQSGCAWNVFTTNAWIAVNSSASNVGSGTVFYSITANESSSSRSGSIRIDGQNFSITQSGNTNVSTTCTFALSPTGTTRSSTASTGTVAVTTQSGCAWNVFTTNTWITINSGISNVGNGTVIYSIAANESPSSRSGNIHIDGQNFLVTQFGNTNISTTCTYSLSGTIFSQGPAAATNSVAVTTQSGCSWNVLNTNAWIMILSSLSNSGNGQVLYSTAVNNLPTERFGMIAIAGKVVTIRQFAPTQYGFDAARDFSTNSNPSGVWGYGWESELAGPVHLFPNTRQAFAPNDMPYDIWKGELTLPNIMHYPWSNPSSGINGTSDLPPGTLLLDPGVEGSGQNFTVVRFLTPSNGWYRLETAVAPCYDGAPQGDTDFHIVKNGDEIVGRFLATPEHFSYVATLLLEDGDTIDFAVGRGADDMEYGSILKLTAILTPTNVPVTPPVCTYAISPSSRIHSSGSTTGIVNVTTQSGCVWNVINTNGWVSILSSLSNSGSGQVIYSFAENTASTGRSGYIRIDGQLFFVSQAPPPNTNTIPLAEALDTTGTSILWRTGGSGVWFGQSAVTHDGVDAARSGPISGNASAGLATTVLGPGILTFWWKVSSETNHDALHFYLSGSELASISGEVDWQQRTINVPAGTQNFEWNYWNDGGGTAGQYCGWVDQVEFVSTGCPVTLSPSNASHPAGTSTGIVSVATPAGCSWTVFSNTNSWISFGSGLSGTGNGTVTYIVAANNSPSSRSGNINIAGQNFLVTQLGNTNGPTPCTFVLSATSTTRPSVALTGTVAVATQSGCAWSAFTTNAWIAISSGVSNVGSGTVIYSITANDNSFSRSGSIRIAGQNFVVNQEGNSTNRLRLYFVGRSANGSNLSLNGETGRVYVVECSEDLIHWTPISTNVGPAAVNDTPPANAPRRFYRTYEVR